jgi:hypothetical protein
MSWIVAATESCLPSLAWKRAKMKSSDITVILRAHDSIGSLSIIRLATGSRNELKGGCARNPVPGEDRDIRTAWQDGEAPLAVELFNDAQYRDGCLRRGHIVLTRGGVAQVQCFGAPVCIGNGRRYVVPALGCYHQIGGVAG